LTNIFILLYFIKTRLSEEKLQSYYQYKDVAISAIFL